MIQLDWTWLVVVPLAVNLAGLFMMAAYYSMRERQRLEATPATRIYRCRNCDRVYIDARDIPLARCPRCAVMNEAVRR